MTYQDRYKPLLAETRAQLKSKGHDKFVDDAEFRYNEFKEHDGFVTCEMSTKGADLDIKMTFLQLMSMVDDASIGYWRIFWCDTCLGHSAEHPFHCEIVRNEK